MRMRCARRRDSLDWLSTPAGASRSFVKDNPQQHWRGARHGDEQASRGQHSQGCREEAIAARDQDHGKEDVHEAEQGWRSIHGAEEEDQVQRRTQREIARLRQNVAKRRPIALQPAPNVCTTEADGMPRAYWKGYLRLSLVTCPIELFPATSQAEKTHFHQINTGTGHRLRQQMVDDQTGRVVDTEHKGRGYELSKGHYVPIDDDELKAVEIESTHTVDITGFVPKAEIDRRYLDKPYYVAPAG